MSNATNQSLCARFQRLRREVNAAFVGRAEEVEAALLAMLVGEHACFLGDPGTAKSAVIRQIVKRIANIVYFFVQLFGETPPNDVFGQVSVRALREEDKNRRNVEGHLPSAHVAFLDEVFNARSTILVGCNSIMQEHQFLNGCEVVECPTRTIFGASNFFPEDPELKAFWDRFIIRKYVKPLGSEKELVEMLMAPEPVADPEPLISLDEWDAAKKEVEAVKLTPAIVQTFVGLVLALRNNEDTPVTVSDRRQKKAMKVLKASAYLAGRTQVCAEDFSALRYVLWSRESHIPVVEETLEKYRPVQTESLEALMSELEAPFEEIRQLNEQRLDLKGKGKKAEADALFNAVRQKASALCQKAEEVKDQFIEVQKRSIGNEADDYIARVSALQENTALILAGQTLRNL